MKFTSLPAAVLGFVALLVPTVGGLPSLPIAEREVESENRAHFLNVQTIHQFPNNTWAENLAIRSNGQVLVTTITSPTLYLIDPSNPKPTTVHTFSNHLSLFGIAELQHDVFYVIAGNYSQPDNGNIPGAWDVYKVNMASSRPSVTLTAHFSKAISLNGMAALGDDFLLVGDSGAGVIYRLNAKTGKIATVIDDPLMKPPPGAPVGLDGVQVRGNYLFYDNGPTGTLVKIQIRAHGTAAGPSEVILRDVFADDFTFDVAGRIYLADFYGDTIKRVTVGHKNATTFAGPSSKLLGPTACKFGRRANDRNLLYVTTNGGLTVGDSAPTQGGTLSRVTLG